MFLNFFLYIVSLFCKVMQEAVVAFILPHKGCTWVAAGVNQEYEKSLWFEKELHLQKEYLILEKVLN